MQNAYVDYEMPYQQEKDEADLMTSSCDIPYVMETGWHREKTPIFHHSWSLKTSCAKPMV